MQAFFFAKNEEALKLAIAESERSNTTIDEQLLRASSKEDGGGWLKVPPIQKILNLSTALRRSDRLHKQFRDLAKKNIRPPDDTRWNSYLNTLEDAFELKQQITYFCINNDRSDDLLTESEWTLIEQTITFLQPFKTATKRLEGDYVTLDKVQPQMDYLVAHYKEFMDIHRKNTSFNESLVASWHAFDKYYRLIDDTGAYTAAILLHPNQRKGYLSAAWSSGWVQPGVERARKIWLQYKEIATSNKVANDVSNLSAFERYEYNIQQKQRRTKAGSQDEFERFINAPADNVKTRALDWWLQPSQQTTYPALSKMAIDVLTAMAMSAESERVFSATRRTIAWTRARLESMIIERLECLKHWHKSGLISHEFVLATEDDSDSEVCLEGYQYDEDIHQIQAT